MNKNSGLSSRYGEGPGSTHWDDCWRSHHGCAVAKIERMEAAALSERGFRQVGQVMYDMAKDGKCAPMVWFESMGALPDGTPIYVQCERKRDE